MAVEEAVKTVWTIAPVSTVGIVSTVASPVNALLERRLQSCVAWTSQLEMAWRCDDNDRNSSK